MPKKKQRSTRPHNDAGCIPGWAHQMRREITRELIHEAYPVALADLTILSIAVLADKFGWGAELLNCYVEALAGNFESLQDGYITLGDMQAAIFEDYGIFIEFDPEVKRMTLETRLQKEN